TRGAPGAFPTRRPQRRGKIERWFRTVRDQFVIEVTDISSEDLAAAGVDHATALMELNSGVRGVGGNRIPPPGAYRDRAEPAGSVGGRLGPGGPPPRPCRLLRPDWRC